jgi:hypothetical protein
MSELVFIMPRAPACAVGVSVTDDLTVIATVGGSHLVEVKFYVNKSERAFRTCPYWPLWKKNVVLVDDSFNVARVLLDAGRGMNCVGFDPAEIDPRSKASGGPTFVSVPKGPELQTWLAWMDDTSFFGELQTTAEESPEGDAALLMYFWNSLNRENGRRRFTQPNDRLEPIYAIVNALAAQDEPSRVIREAAQRERSRLWQLRHGAAKDWADAHGGTVKVRLNPGNVFEVVDTVSFERAVEYVEMGSAKYVVPMS